MARDALTHQRIAVLRAVAMCIAREAGDVRIREDSYAPTRRDGARMRLLVELGRDEFWRAEAELQRRGLATSARLFDRHRGPGERDHAAMDRAVDACRALVACAEAGYQPEVSIDPMPGVYDARVPLDEQYTTVSVRVPSQAYATLLAHLPVPERRAG